MVGRQSWETNLVTIQKLKTFQVKMFCGLSDIGNKRTEFVNVASVRERMLVVLACDFSSTTFRELRIEAETQKVVPLLWALFFTLTKSTLR